MVACAKYDVINLCRATILKMDCASFQLGDKWLFCYLWGPFESHRSSSPTADDFFSAVLKTLESDVFCWISRTNDKNSFAFEVRGISEAMWVNHSTGKLANSRKGRYVGYGEVPSCYNDVVKSLSRKDLIFWKIFDDYSEVVGRIVVGYLTYNMTEVNPRTKFAFWPSACERKCLLNS